MWERPIVIRYFLCSSQGAGMGSCFMLFIRVVLLLLTGPLKSDTCVIYMDLAKAKGEVSKLIL